MIFKQKQLLICLQAKFEVTATGAWSDGDPSSVMREAKKRLKKQGWERVRPALAMTIR